VNNKKNKIFLLISIVLYIISLTQISYCIPGSCKNFSGLLSLIFGWVGVFMLHFPAFPWLANPILLASWITHKKKPKVSLILSVVSLTFMLSFLLVDEIIANDGSTKAKIISVGLGYWLWVMSAIFIIIGNLAQRKRKN
jgi:small neutral amino acid transporter SnatA (MarC family)